MIIFTKKMRKFKGNTLIYVAYVFGKSFYFSKVYTQTNRIYKKHLRNILYNIIAHEKISTIGPEKRRISFDDSRSSSWQSPFLIFSFFFFPFFFNPSRDRKNSEIYRTSIHKSNHLFCVFKRLVGKE